MIGRIQRLRKKEWGEWLLGFWLVPSEGKWVPKTENSKKDQICGVGVVEERRGIYIYIYLWSWQHWIWGVSETSKCTCWVYPRDRVESRATDWQIISSQILLMVRGKMKLPGERTEKRKGAELSLEEDKYILAR